MSIGRILIGIILLLSLVYFVSAKKVVTAPAVNPNESNVQNIVSEISIGDLVYAYTFTIVDPARTTLIANFDEKNSSQSISVNNNCSFGINGSFYNENWQPLAGWESNGEVRKLITHNNLLNGYLGLSNTNELIIGKINPSEKMKWGMQSGPVLINEGAKEKLALASDKPARRSIAGVTSNGDLILLSIFSPDSRYDGPTLENLPEVLLSIADKENLNISTAINLDGGSASAFYSPSIKLPELIAVGSWICVN